MPWDKHAAIWSTLLSLIAIILSQLPPITTWVAHREVKSELSRFVTFPTNIGIPSLELFLKLENSGNRPASISDIKISLRYPNGTEKEMPAEYYTRTNEADGSQQFYPIANNTLGSGQTWAALVTFSPMHTPSDEEKIIQLRQEFNQYYSIHPPHSGQISNSISVSPTLASDAIAFFEGKFDLETGDYTAQLTAVVNGKRTLLKTFSFVLYEYQLSSLRSRKDGLKFGYGVNFENYDLGLIGSPIRTGD